MNHLITLTRQFELPGEVLEIRRYGKGNVNDTYIVHTDASHENTFILQCVNQHVFPKPERIMENMQHLFDHISRQLKHGSTGQARPWKVMRIFSTANNIPYFIDKQNRFWRVLGFIDQATAYETIQNTAHAHEAGAGLGYFHHLTCNLQTETLHDTLPGFHQTPLYLKNYDATCQTSKRLLHSPEVRFCHDFISSHRSLAPILEKAKDEGKLMQRVIHGDPKINNIMIDDISSRVISLVDLDTVKPGLIHYDIGDCLRSCCNLMGEETADPHQVSFETDIAKTILQGYGEQTRFLTANDKAFLFDAIQLIAFELGLRFFSDYLAGNVYFKVKDETHNLRRAMVQFHLTKSIENQEKQLRRIINELPPA